MNDDGLVALNGNGKCTLGMLPFFILKKKLIRRGGKGFGGAGERGRVSGKQTTAFQQGRLGQSHIEVSNAIGKEKENVSGGSRAGILNKRGSFKGGACGDAFLEAKIPERMLRIFSRFDRVTESWIGGGGVSGKNRVTRAVGLRDVSKVISISIAENIPVTNGAPRRKKCRWQILIQTGGRPPEFEGGNLLRVGRGLIPNGRGHGQIPSWGSEGTRYWCRPEGKGCLRQQKKLANSGRYARREKPYFSIPR